MSFEVQEDSGDYVHSKSIEGVYVQGPKAAVMSVHEKVAAFDRTHCLDKLAAALAKAQAELEGAKKSATNPGFRSKYARLDGVWEAWQEVGPKYGLSVVQLVCDAGGERQGIMLKTILMHESGQSIESTSYWPAVKNDPQGYGSALTYARRYSLMALTGICPVDDDDGNAAVKAQQAQGTQTQAQLTEEFRKRFLAGIEQHWDKAEKLTIIMIEADKVGLSDVAKKAHARIQELRTANGP